MKHSIRQRVLDPVTGLKVTKIEAVNGELGSGIFDCNNREIYEGDIFNDEGDTYTVIFADGSFWANEQILEHFKDAGVEVIGHVD